MGLDWTLPRLPVSLPAKPVPYVNDLAILKDRFAEALLNLNEHDFTPRAVWRDLFALTGTSRTFYGPESIAGAWKETSTSQSPFGFSFSENPVSGGQNNEPWLELPFTFQILGPPAITGSASLSIVCNDEGQWQIWMLKTMAEQLTGQRNVDEKQSLQDVPPSKTGQTEYDCVILGGGQAGLGVAGRLHTLGVSYIVFDKNARVGDSWRNRYRSAKLHTIREHAHLPFERTFDAANYPNEFLTKDQLAEGYEAWVSRYNINVWSGAEIISACWNEETNMWQVTLQRGASSASETIMTRYFIYAAGVGCNIPKMPSFDNRESFEGVVMHSNDYRDASAWSGKRAVIIGSANTAHDVAEDMLAANLASVCMVQRSPTLIVNTKHYSAITRKLYNENFDTAVADQKISTGPSAVSRLVMLRALEGMQKDDPDDFDDYERAGFKVDRDSDLLHALLVRRGGHYMDVGGMKNIATGKVQVKSHAIPPRFCDRGLIFQDGEVLDADVVVMATGFENEMNPEFSRLFGPDMAAQLEHTEGIDEEGEIKGLYKPTSPFWVTGGALGQGRFFSRFIALQVKAKLLGTPFRVYNRTP